MITLEDDQLVFRFPELHPHAVCKVSLQRTLRLPDDGSAHPLPPSLGRFPMRHATDFRGKLGDDVAKRGGVIAPMHRSEAAWLNFQGSGGEDAYPFAIKIAAGKINAVTGAPWSTGLSADSQDYVVLPAQPWIDGFAIAKGVIRQFVAEQLGRGRTVEEQLTGRSEFGGLQILAYPMKRERFEQVLAQRRNAARRRELAAILDDWRWRFESAHRDARAQVASCEEALDYCDTLLARSSIDDVPNTSIVLDRLNTFYSRIRGGRSGTPLRQDLGELMMEERFEPLETRRRQVSAAKFSMGLAAGGRIRQEIYVDEYGVDAWDQRTSSRCFISLLEAGDWLTLTGEHPPTKPPIAKDYKAAGLPWFDYYRPEKIALKGSKALAKIKSWAAFEPEASKSTPASPTIQLGTAPRTTSIVIEPEDDA